jgi:hypothetical protein
VAAARQVLRCSRGTAFRAQSQQMLPQKTQGSQSQSLVTARSAAVVCNVGAAPRAAIAVQCGIGLRVAWNPAMARTAICRRVAGLCRARHGRQVGPATVLRLGVRQPCCRLSARMVAGPATALRLRQCSHATRHETAAATTDLATTEHKEHKMPCRAWRACNRFAFLRQICYSDCN